MIQNTSSDNSARDPSPKIESWHACAKPPRVCTSPSSLSSVGDVFQNFSERKKLFVPVGSTTDKY